MKGPGLSLVLVLVAAPALAACSTAPGTGWSRSSDLGVYSAMNVLAGVAQEQATLCRGFRPQNVAGGWERDFGLREEAVTALLVSRHGEAAVSRAADSEATRTVSCRAVPDRKWRRDYARLLRLLEIRLGLA